MGAYFDHATGKMVAGKMVGGRYTASGDTIDLAVSEAVGRCMNKRYKASALVELKKLLEEFPQLKSDSWTVGEHPCSPLIDIYVRQLFG